ncbi:MAG: hypothetical protein AB9856_20475 [Cellulosilyticaceae bacterium]
MNKQRIIGLCLACILSLSTTLFAMPTSSNTIPSVQNTDTLNDYNLSMQHPHYIGNYPALNPANEPLGAKEFYPLILLKFAKNNEIANIGALSLHTPEQYGGIKEEGTEEATLVSQHHTEASELLKTIKLTSQEFDFVQLEGVPIANTTIKSIDSKNRTLLIHDTLKDQNLLLKVSDETQLNFSDLDKVAFFEDFKVGDTIRAIHAPFIESSTANQTNAWRITIVNNTIK